MNRASCAGSRGVLKVSLVGAKDATDGPGEEWKLTKNTDGTYTIRNSMSDLYLGTHSTGGYRYPLVQVQKKAGDSDQRWVVRSSGLFGSFTLHPATAPERSVQLRTSPAAQSGILWVAPHHGYLHELFTIVPGRAK